MHYNLLDTTKINSKHGGVNMETLTNTNTGCDMNSVTEGASQFGIGIILTLAALVGVWGVTCLVSGLAHNGVMEMGRGFITAITGM
jgi:hypothetical protein